MQNSLNFGVIYLSAMALLFSQTIPAYAGVIGTEQFLNQQVSEINRDTLSEIFSRDEARMLLEKHGVTSEQAQARINAMTDEEVRIFAQKFEELPAGGVGIVAAVLILVLLFIALELSGKTDVFKGM